MMKLNTAICLLASVGCTVAQSYPSITLPWGVWQAADFSYDDFTELYIFQNVRFGAQPARFQQPNFPTTQNSSVQDPSYGPSCIQLDTSTLKNPPPGGRNPGLHLPGDDSAGQSEDCLFLDIYAPASNFDDWGNPIQDLPVIVWFYGGAYAFGSKQLSGDVPLYTGESTLMAMAEEYQAVFVAGNYRLGALGWLAGSYMETVGQPNAGLYDQSLLLEWVKEYIGLVGGDPAQVTAWGESAGAGSILHHLIRQSGTVDPLFSTFLVQSPAFEWSWDNSKGGTMDSVYRNFSQLAGCGYNYNISCLNNASLDTLVDANNQLFDNIKPTGLFPVGPSVDGDWIQTLPALSFANGLYWKGINSSLISHVYNETASFTPAFVTSQNSFDHFLNLFFPESDLGDVRKAIASQYNCSGNYGGDFRLCVADMIRDSTFTCNTRQLFEAFPRTSYMLRYSFMSDYNADVHASDLVPTFMNGFTDAYNMFRSAKVSRSESFALATILDVHDGLSSWYQTWLAYFGVTGNPNSNNGVLYWPLAVEGEKLSNVMEVYDKDSTRLISDDQNTKSTCTFWTDIAKAIVATKDQDKIQSAGEISEILDL